MQRPLPPFDMDNGQSGSYSPHSAPSSGGKHDDGKDLKPKTAISRVNRACNACRKMKMRCVGAEDPPCRRCRNAGIECVMEKPGRTGEPGAGEDRIRSLETQVTSIQHTLTDLVATLRAGMSSNTSNGSAGTPEHVPGNFGSGAAPFGNLFPGAQGSPRGPLSMTAAGTAAAGTAATGPASTGATPPSGPHVLGGYMGHQASQPSATFNPYATTTGNTLAPASYAEPLSRPSAGQENFRRPLPPAIASAQHWHSSVRPGSSHTSLPPSRAGSETPDDILNEDGIVNPLGTLSSMAGLVEAAVERAREEKQRAASVAVSAGHPTPSAGQKREYHHTIDPSAPGHMPKRPRMESAESPVTRTIVEAQGLPLTLTSKPKSKSRKTHVHAFPDVVEMGYVSEEETLQLMDIYYSGSSNFLSCYDPSFDTYESLKIRSPFSITCMTMVGARVRDGGGPVGEVQRLSREHAQKIAMGTLFNPVARIEAVQAMTILAGFSDNGWCIGGHAVRMAIDMGINKSFLRLLRSGMGKGKSAEELEEERPLVVHSRVWLCLYLMEHQMAYGMGRPAILREDESIHQCRRLLEHPLSIPTDARLISTVELTALRAPLHIELTASPDLPIDQNTLKRLKQANHEFDSWERYWDRVLSERYAKERDDFFRESLAIQRQYAELFVNSQLLRGIREPSDVVSMPEEKRLLAIRAMKNAQACLEICLRRESYRNGLRYAVHYTHVCAAFAASFLIRIARLFPRELNLKKTAKDVEELACVLSEIPAGRYARSLRLILRRARRQKVIPGPSHTGSPTRPAATLSMTSITASTPAAASAAASGAGTGAAASPLAGTSGRYPLHPPVPGITPTAAAASPTLLLSAASQILDDSPSAGSVNEISEFDFLFAQENLERSGLELGEGDPLPLFLDGHSLGGSTAPTDMAPFVGLENFFLPADVDNRLAGGGDVSGLNEVGGDLWW